MASPTDFVWRTFTNKSGKTYEAGSTQKPFAEDMNVLGTAFEDGALGVLVTFMAKTTAERDALTPYDGMLLYNTDNNRLEAYENGSWGVLGGTAYPFSSGAGDPSSAPSQIGALYYDTTNTRLWFGTGTGAVSDWKELLLGGSP